MEEEFLLKWHDHHTSFFLLVEELVTREQLTDVTLSCGDMILNAHSLMLSVCSPYFRSLLSENQHREKHHIIHLNGVSGRLMQQLLVYMYRGELSIAQDDLGPLIETARCLQIKGLSMASSDIQTSRNSSKKRSASQTPEQSALHKPKERKIAKKHSPVKCLLGPRTSSPSLEVHEITRTTDLAVGQDFAGAHDLVIEEEREEDEEEYSGMTEYPQYTIKEYSENGENYGKGGKGSFQSGPVSLPMLPKPLSILKTAETRTYLSKLIWLGNGGRRPQYGNPDTKPQWWPQHVLPWEEMKKMGGRKSQELSHINYTEILKQCLAAGYEYFGYDPSTYFCSDPPDLETSYTEETSYDDYSALALSSDQDMEVQEQELQIDLGATSSESKILDRDQQDQILCK